MRARRQAGRRLALCLLAAIAPALHAGHVSAQVATPSAAPPAALGAPQAAKAAFAADYTQSRASFRAACAASGADCASFALRYPSIADDDLTIDTAYARRGNRRLLILQSGIHGAEANTGAAVQALVFARYLPRLLDHGWDVLMIHAFNPYGFKYGRRVDGNNVDLNRSFPAGDDLALYRSANPDYDALRSWAEPATPVSSVPWESTSFAIGTIWRTALHGFSARYIGNGLHAGQYSNKDGFEFGGAAPPVQARFLRERVAPLIAAHPGEVLVWDMHSGLGAANTLSVYSGTAWPPARLTAVRAWVSDPPAPGIRFQEPRETDYQTSGDVIDYYPGLAGTPRLVAVTMEWGTLGESTLPSIISNTRMLLEHQAFRHGCVSAEICAEVRRNFAAMFNPPDPGFQDAVISEATVMLDRVLALPPGALSGAP